MDIEMQGWQASRLSIGKWSLLEQSLSTTVPTPLYTESWVLNTNHQTPRGNRKLQASPAQHFGKWS